MKHFHAFQARLGFATLAAGLLFASQVGSAAADIHPSSYVTKTVTVTVASAGTGAATATCPSGDLVITGGAYWHPTNSTTSDPSLYTHIDSSSPTTNLSGWYVTGTNSTTQSLQLTAIAQCLPKSALGSYTVLKREVVVDPDRPGNADLKCKSGQLVVAGGGTWHKPGKNPKAGLSAHLSTSSPDSSASGWSVAGANLGASILDLRVLALCVPASIVSGSYPGHPVSITALNYGQFADTYLQCPANELAVAGGVVWSHGDGGPDTDSRNVIESSSVTADGTQWYAAMRFADVRLGGSESYRVSVDCLNE